MKYTEEQVESLALANVTLRHQIASLESKPGRALVVVEAAKGMASVSYVSAEGQYQQHKLKQALSEFEAEGK